MAQYIGMIHRTLTERLTKRQNSGFSINSRIHMLSRHWTKTAARKVEIAEAN